jgi:hypothetical protein
VSREDTELARLLRLARQADLPDPARLARVRARVLPPPTPPVDGGSPPSATGPASGAAPAAGTSFLGAKIAVGLATASLVIWSYVDLTRSTPAPAPAPAHLQPPAATLEPSIPPVTGGTAGAMPSEAAPAETPSRVPNESSKRAQPRAPSRRKAEPLPVAKSTLAEEAALLQLTAVALRAGQLERARTTLEDFARRYPDSQLSADRLKLERRLEQMERAVSPDRSRSP